MGKPVEEETNHVPNKTKGIIKYAGNEKKGRKIIMNLILGVNIINNPAIAKIAPDAPTADIKGLPKILLPKSVFPK
ncbi:hypothetical protein ES703_116121 [subsurface metagenome]